jgi:spore coat protein U-like protein
MTDTKTALMTLLTTDPGVSALVPAGRIYQSWPTSFATLPLITFTEINNSTEDVDYADDVTISGTSEMQISVFCTPQTSTTPIVLALNAAMEGALWNRDYSGDFVEKDTGIQQKVLRYSKRIYEP